MKSLMTNDGWDVEVIPSSVLVAMEIKRLSREQGKPVTVQESRGDRWLAKVGIVLAGCLGLYMAIHIVVALVK